MNKDHAKKTVNDAYDLISSVINCHRNELSSESNISNTAGWDSFVHLEIMLILEEKYNIEINEENIIFYTQLKNIEKLFSEDSKR